VRNVTPVIARTNELQRPLLPTSRVPHRHRSHALFCIRLHSVRKERIGVKEISAQRFLTIGEDAQRYVFCGRNFETTANTMTISRQGSHRKELAALAVIGREHCGHVMLRERG